MQQQPIDITAIIYRLEAAERDIKRISDQLPQYATASIQELKLQSIQDAVKRVETDVGKAKDELVNMNAKLTQQEQATLQRDAAQRESQDKLQIRVLIWVVSIVVSIGLLLFGAFITHVIH